MMGLNSSTRRIFSAFMLVRWAVAKLASFISSAGSICIRMRVKLMVMFWCLVVGGEGGGGGGGAGGGGMVNSSSIRCS